MYSRSPAADDLISGQNAAGKAAILESRIGARQAWIGVLEPFAEVIERNGQSVPQLAHFIVIAAQGMKYAADGNEDLLDLLAALKSSILCVVGEPA